MSHPISDLNKNQQGVIHQTDGPILILAGAGSGKTRVLTHKVAYLLKEKKIPADQILAVTFTNKAANEMRGRVIRLLARRLMINGDEKISKSQKVEKIPFIGTFHSFCAKLLRKEGRFLGFSPNFLIYDEDDSQSLVKNLMGKEGISSKQFKPGAVLETISRAKNELISPNDYYSFASGFFFEQVSKIYPLYQKELLNLNAMDFDDLLYHTCYLFDKLPKVAKSYQERFHYVLVDEYQDVNTAQYFLTKKLSQSWGNLTVVGDASQAIYSFRGADWRNIANFKNDFPHAKIFNLDQNYRSTQKILDAAHSVIQHNQSHPILYLWTKNEEGDKLSIFQAQNEVDEGNFVIEKILETDLPLSYYAVLYRTNAQSRSIEEALVHAAIPYHLFGGVRFYARKEIKDIISFLRLMVNLKDLISRKRVEKLGKKRSGKFFNLLEKGNLAKLKPVEAIEKVCDETNYLTLLDDGTEQGLQRIENVKELKSVASLYEDIVSFLENISLMEDENLPQYSLEDKKEKVTLMTVHQAKGLEFPVVFIIGLEEGLFPHSRSMLDQESLEEERRLFYVALTRAMKKVYFSYTRDRLYFGRRTQSIVSRFLTDIPQHLLTYEESQEFPLYLDG